jgi:PAS domain S-box-containing protein
LKISDKTKEKLEKELNQLKDKITQFDDLRIKYEKTLQKLRKTEEKYEFIVNAHGEFMSLINSKYRYEAVNDAYCIAHSKTREDFIGKSVADLWGQDVFENTIKESLDKCFQGAIVKNETSFIFAKLQYKYYDVNYYPYKNKKGEVTHVVVVTRDITEKKLAEIELIKSEQKLRESNDIKDEYLMVINSDLEKAFKYVLSLLPPPIKDGPVKTSWQIFPSSKLGGDSFGYHWLDNEHLAIYLLDVSGHGVGSALHSITALNMLRFNMLPKTDFYDPASVLSSLNKTFQMGLYYNMYITMWYCVYDIKNRKLIYAGAGHPPIIVFSNNGEIKKIESNNFIIGNQPDYEYQYGTINLESDSRLYLYSDGAYEIQKVNGDMMTNDDIIEFLNSRDNDDGTEIMELYEHLKTVSSTKLEDDFIMLKVKV